MGLRSSYRRIHKAHLASRVGSASDETAISWHRESQAALLEYRLASDQALRWQLPDRKKSATIQAASFDPSGVHTMSWIGFSVEMGARFRDRANRKLRNRPAAPVGRHLDRLECLGDHREWSVQRRTLERVHVHRQAAPLTAMLLPSGEKHD
jgi:hypothetical protein